MDGSTLLLAIVFGAIGYGCGSVPVGVLVARATGGPDPRTVGSGRTGTQNSLRAMGPRGAGLVAVGDFLKGFVPVGLAWLVSNDDLLVEAAAGIAAVIGSCRSLFLGLTGGRGVVTLAGTIFVIQPWALLVAAPVLVATLLVSGYLSLGSLFGCAALPIGVLAAGMSTGAVDWGEFLYASLGAGIVWLAHRDNIDRLLNGTERRFDYAALRGKGGG
ncbi:MAG TPA: glycerol-3-phosphate acyltransferase [Candidatus Limnocylindrales bacterium]|nr:glycerol-3-phosphate acyltransferase [Candidatus Limnocylindrales bacterium]